MSDQWFRLQASFPAETEGWADELLRETLAPKDEVTRTEDELFVASIRGGNVDAITHARSFLHDFADAFSEGGIDIPRFTLEVASAAPLEEEFPREDLLEIWEHGEPASVISMTLIRHSTTCAVTASGHRGPCTCAAAGGVMSTTDQGEKPSDGL